MAEIGITNGLRIIDQIAGAIRLKSLTEPARTERRGVVLGIREIDSIILQSLDETRREQLANGGKMIIDIGGRINYQ